MKETNMIVQDAVEVIDTGDAGGHQDVPEDIVKGGKS
jgi:hypothetical protein